MKRTRTTFVLLFIFFILTTVYFARVWTLGYLEKQRIETRNLVSIKNPEEINIIEVKRPNYNFVMEKTDDNQWMIGKYEAVPSFIENIFRVINNTRIVSYVSNSLENKDKFQLSPDTAIEFLFKKDDMTLGQFTAGIRRERSGDAFYVIRQGENKIALSEELFGSLFYDELRSALVEKAERDKITQVVISRKKENVTVKKDNDIWLVNGRLARQEKVDDFLNRVSKISADEFLNADEPAEYDTKIEITADGKVYMLEVGKKPESPYYYIKNSKGVAYLIVEETHGKIVRDAKYFFSAT